MACVALKCTQLEPIAISGVVRRDAIGISTSLICETGYYLIVNPDKVVWAYPDFETMLNVISNVDWTNE